LHLGRDISDDNGVIQGFALTDNREVFCARRFAAVFLKVFTKIKAYNPDGGTFRSWLFTVATNTMIDYCRKSSVRLEITPEEMPEKIDVSQDHMKIFQQLEDKVLIRNILDQLSVKYQKILHLKFFAELSHIEIAEIMNISPNNVGVLVHRALGKFYVI
jgi:RNA polymerase sigma-70 factor (ECF subfamily)